jgi:signal transduction histidine kinase/ligand-binding sensor domain-containing protein/AraC-like DNA-binding protein
MRIGGDSMGSSNVMAEERPATHRVCGFAIAMLRLTRAVIAGSILASVPALAAVPATTFTHLGARDGLPGQSVRALAQDHEGYMWFGTTAGLARFDGLTMTVYRHERDQPRSLASDQVNGMYVDRAHRLWIGTDDGLCLFIGETRDFDCFADLAMPAKDVAGIAETRDGTLWFSGNGLHRLNPATRESAQWDYPAPAESTHHVSNVYVDSKERIWVATFDAGLFLFDRSANSFTPVALGIAEKKKTFMDDTVWSVYEDRSGIIWVGSSSGLSRLSADGRLEAFYTYNYGHADDPHGLSNNRVDVVREDRDGNLWIGTYDGGVDRYERATDTFRRYQPDARNPHSIGTGGVADILQDRSGLLWFAGRGVERLDLSSEQIMLHQPPPGHPASTSARTAEHLAIDSNGIVLLGSTGGLARYDPATDAWSNHLAAPDHPDWPNNWIFGIVVGNGSTRYIGAAQGLRLFDDQSKTFSPHVPGPNSPTAMYQDRSGQLWAALVYAGIAKYDAAAKALLMPFASNPNDPESLGSLFIHFMYEDSAGRFWVGTDRGLTLLDRGTGQTRRFGVEGGKPGGPSHYTFKAVAEDSSGALWLGTPRGLNRFDPGTGEFQSFTTEDGLAHDLVSAVVIDALGYVWVGTEGGLSRFDPKTHAFRNFYVENGLPDNEVLKLAIAPDGKLFVSTFQGLVSLDPAQLETTSSAPTVAVSHFEIHASPVYLRPDVDGGTDAPTHLTLTHSDDVVSFELAVLDYRDPPRNRYAYQMSGIDSDWVYTEGADRRATYTTLPPGEYVFRYKGVGASGGWRDDAHAIALTVLPPPWATGWAYLAYAIALLLGITLVVRLRTRAANQRAAVLEATVAERTRELQRQTDTIQHQTERLQQVVDAKDRLYANVSHEFRTPLTVILGPVERLLAQEDSPRRRTHLEIIKRNGQRLLRLVEQLMTLARIDAQRTSHPNPLQIAHVVRTLVSSFATLAEDKNIQLSFTAAGDPWIACDIDSLEKITVNLISNAIKYTPMGGVITVSVAAERAGWVSLTVSDTGVGIPEIDQQRVFERFYRVGDQQETAAGTGLGLSLVKELVEAFGGAVTLNSELGVGTSVSVALQQCEPPAAGVETMTHRDRSTVSELEVATLEVEDAIEALQQEGKGMPTALVIEDNPDLCWHVGEVLHGQVRCEFAHNGEAGVAAAFETIPDIILCDVALPKLNGFEVTRRIKEDERTCHIPIIMLTARSDEESRIQGLQSLADEYLTKPFNEAELKQRIETLLSIREILRQRFARDSRRLSLDDLPPEVGARDRRFLERLGHVVEAHYADPDFSMTEFASLMAMSERQLQRKMKALTNSLPREYLRGFRLEKAVQLLKAGEPAGSVAFAVGFSSQSYFTSCFKAEYGVTPGSMGNHRTSAGS